MEIQDEATLRVWEQYAVAIEVNSNALNMQYTHMVTIVCADRSEAQQIADQLALVMMGTSDISWTGDPKITFLNALDPIAISRKVVLSNDAPSRRIRTGRKR